MFHRFVENTAHFLRYRKVTKFLKPCHTIVDLGCGNNYRFLKKIHSMARKCWGLDTNITNCEANNITLINYDITQKLPFPDDSVDLITMLAVVEHIDNPLSVLKECHRCLRKDSILIVTTPSKFGIRIHEFLRRFKLVRDVKPGEHKDFHMSGKLLAAWGKEAGFWVTNLCSFECGLNLLMVCKKGSTL